MEVELKMEMEMEVGVELDQVKWPYFNDVKTHKTQKKPSSGNSGSGSGNGSGLSKVATF